VGDRLGVVDVVLVELDAHAREIGDPEVDLEDHRSGRGSGRGAAVAADPEADDRQHGAAQGVVDAHHPAVASHRERVVALDQVEALGGGDGKELGAGGGREEGREDCESEHGWCLR
jgi:hypothetical protein